MTDCRVCGQPHGDETVDCVCCERTVHCLCADVLPIQWQKFDDARVWHNWVCFMCQGEGKHELEDKPQ